MLGVGRRVFVSWVNSLFDTQAMLQIPIRNGLANVELKYAFIHSRIPFFRIRHR
ncbi:hypothetical protein Hsero_3404 [Herbaspirillum seropedicae SmR1]|uniref:Uncharacterized protein n=1 Tax=Herbaspirillum seropedicae (strain SmR1) TaxID=757424 RepID=D8IPI8_HERSS|nr:hypothetical protein Hsero_3404 [Herbaspirillum seropedicae SmR1]